MDRQLLINIIRFLILLTVQIVLLNNITLFETLRPYLYILAIFLLPVELSKAFVLLIAFITGFIVDVFSGTYGIHTFAAVLLAYTRPIVLTELMPFDGYDKFKDLLPAHYGLKWFLKYTLWLTATHHLALILLEAFSLNNIGLLLSHWIGNVLLTEFLLILTVFAFFRHK